MHNDKKLNKESNKQRYGSCAIYTRKSTVFEKDEDINDNSFQRLICAMAIKLNMEDEFAVSSKRYDDVENDESDDERSIDNRLALQELFEDVKDGLVDTVIVHSMSILSTSFKTVDKIVKVFKEQGTRVILASQGVDTAKANGRRFFLHISSLAQYESEEREYFKNEQ